MNNEPVAELLVNDGEPWNCRYNDNITLPGVDGWIPLYTHPKELTLTKHEMKIMWSEAIVRAYKEDAGEAHEFFAEAILRKVQKE